MTGPCLLARSPWRWPWPAVELQQACSPKGEDCRPGPSLIVSRSPGSRPAKIGPHHSMTAPQVGTKGMAWVYTSPLIIQPFLIFLALAVT